MALTSYRMQTDGQDASDGSSPSGTPNDEKVRTWKDSNRAKGTHLLESADGQTSEDTERKWLSEGNSLPGEHRPTDK
jgi:hypothetical protein